jgi:hypothetical protein
MATDDSVTTADVVPAAFDLETAGVKLSRAAHAASCLFSLSTLPSSCHPLCYTSAAVIPLSLADLSST